MTSLTFRATGRDYKTGSECDCPRKSNRLSPRTFEQIRRTHLTNFNRSDQRNDVLTLDMLAAKKGSRGEFEFFQLARFGAMFSELSDRRKMSGETSGGLQNA